MHVDLNTISRNNESVLLISLVACSLKEVFAWVFWTFARTPMLCFVLNGSICSNVKSSIRVFGVAVFACWKEERIICLWCCVAPLISEAFVLADIIYLQAAYKSWWKLQGTLWIILHLVYFIESADWAEANHNHSQHHLPQHVPTMFRVISSTLRHPATLL